MTQENGISGRRQQVAEVIAQKGFVQLTELASLLGVSESTVRRDLEALERVGGIRRTHGGALCLAEPAAAKLGFADRQATAVAEKRAIAAAIARMIPDDQTVILDGGTTCCHVAAALAGRRLSVITNSVPIAALLGGEINTEVTLIGGYLYPRTGVALGEMAESMLASLRAAQLVLSCAAVSDDGLFNVNQMMTAVQRRMIEVADEVILAVDHSKFGRRAISPLCPWSEIDVVVTDWLTEAETRQRLQERGVKVVVAEAPA